MPPRVLVIDDDAFMRSSLEAALTRARYDVQVFEDARAAFAEAERRTPHVIITDLRMPGVSGLEVVSHFRRTLPQVPVLLITAHATIATAVQAMKDGAWDYIEKPFEVEALEAKVRTALEGYQLRREVAQLRAEREAAPRHELLVGTSEAMQAVARQLDQIAAASATVLIQGESGTGKEVVAQQIHFRGPRAVRPFYAVNCAALSAGLLESELFGHEKGAFTGADSRREGRFELADGGTILLDEVSEIPPELQAKLLRVLQEREFERVGSSQTIRVDVRVLATTNRRLHDWVKKGRFREDLYFRLNVVPLMLPPLRERRADVPLLAAHFVRRFGARDGRADLRLSAAALARLAAYDWPGNVRELANVLERAVALHPVAVLEPEHIAAGLSDGALVPTGEGYAPGMPLEEVERRHIAATLEKLRFDRGRTAEALGITTKTLRAKIRKWQLLPADEAEGEDGNEPEA